MLPQFHLHGHRFWVVGYGSGNWTLDNVTSYNLEHPLLRDTATLLPDPGTAEAAGWMVLRFVADNPGVWPLHCHIAWHHFMGQQVHCVAATRAQEAPLPAGWGGAGGALLLLS